MGGSRLQLRAARVFDGHNLLLDAGVVVADGLIVDVGPWREVRSSTRKVETQDLGDMSVIPGLINAHIHLTFSGNERAMVDIAEDSREVLLLRAVRNAEAALRAGVTTVRDCGDRGNVTLPLRDAIAHGLVRGPRVLACGMPLTTRNGHCHFLGLEVDGDSAVNAVRRQAATGVDWIKVMATGGRLTTGSNPGQLQFSPRELDSIAAQAHSLGRRVAAHALAASGIRAAVAAGIDTIEHVSWLAADGISRDYDRSTVAESIRRGLWLSVTNAHSSHQHRAMLGERNRLSVSDKRGLEMYEVQLGLIAQMHKDGGQLIVTDDAGCPGVSSGDFPLALASLGARTEIPAPEVLSMATANAARALGIDNQIGTIAPGRLADLVAVRGDPTDRLRDLTRTERVWQAGRLVVSAGCLL